MKYDPDHALYSRQNKLSMTIEMKIRENIAEMYIE